MDFISDSAFLGARRLPDSSSARWLERHRVITGDDPDEPPRANAVIEWLHSRPETLEDYLDRLLRQDLTLGGTLRELFDLPRAGDRLALTLFIDYAAGQGLDPGEIAMLLGDARRDLREAIEYLVDAAAARVQSAVSTSFFRDDD